MREPSPTDPVGSAMMRIGRGNRPQSIWTVLASGGFFTALSILFVDRPAATFLHAARHGASVMTVTSFFREPFTPIATVLLAAAAAYVGMRQRPPPWTRTLITCCLAVIVSLVMKEQLKFVFGRTWPESWDSGAPSWIGTGDYGFHPFHGGQGWASFPSGHTAMVTSAAGVLWQRVANLRWLWGSVVGMVVLALFGADCHFVGDIVAGFYLGIGCATLVLALCRRVGWHRPSIRSGRLGFTFARGAPSAPPT